MASFANYHTILAKLIGQFEILYKIAELQYASATETVANVNQPKHVSHLFHWSIFCPMKNIKYVFFSSLAVRAKDMSVVWMGSPTKVNVQRGEVEYPWTMWALVTALVR